MLIDDSHQAHYICRCYHATRPASLHQRAPPSASTSTTDRGLPSWPPAAGRGVCAATILPAAESNLLAGSTSKLPPCGTFYHISETLLPELHLHHPLHRCCWLLPASNVWSLLLLPASARTNDLRMHASMISMHCHVGRVYTAVRRKVCWMWQAGELCTSESVALT